MAVRTSRVTLGVEVVALPRRRPWNVAREAAAVDQLSGGRLVVGFGAGDAADPGFTHVGEELDPRVRAERLDEGLEIVNGPWRSGSAAATRARAWSSGPSAGTARACTSATAAAI